MNGSHFYLKFVQKMLHSSCVGTAKSGCHEVWNLSREVIPLTHSDTCTINKIKSG